VDGRGSAMVAKELKEKGRRKTIIVRQSKEDYGRRGGVGCFCTGCKGGGVEDGIIVTSGGKRGKK